jgi:hypothetical protein
MVTKSKEFEDYLKETHAMSYHGTDDDMPDAFGNWLGDLDENDITQLAEMYGDEQFSRGRMSAFEEVIEFSTRK